MRNTSTPLRQVCLQNRLNSNGRRSMNSSRTVKQLNQQQTPVLLENTDDELERAERRRSVALRKSITNLPSSSLNDSFQQFSEDDMKYQIQFCTKLYNENRINPKNVWGLQIIDALKHMVKIDVQTDLLRVVGSSLEVAGKVYAVRVDSLYEQGMRMASNLARQFKQNTEDATNDVSTGEGEVLDHVRKKRAKPKFFLNGKKKVTVNSENWQDSLLKLESCVFSARTDPNLSAIENLFTNTLKMDSSCLKFMPLSTDKSWITNGDCLITKQKKYSFKAPKLDNFRLCIPFKDFTLDEWNVDDKKELSDVAMDSADQLIFDDNGIPIHQMDGSLHHVFEEPGVGDDDDDDLHNVEEVNAVPNFREDVEYIVDLRPTNQYSSSIERSECPMNSLVQTMFGRMEDIWAGPSHWKLKFIKSSTSMYTGRVEHQAPIERKKRKKQDWQPHDLEQFINAPAYDTSQKAVQRNVKLVDRSKLCVPLPDPTAYPRFKQNLDYLMTNTIRKIKLSQKSSESELVDCDVSAYKYDNPTDVNYLPQHDVR
ncbi:condensin complex subunit 2 isoform X2 [Cylas formicarius]|uniref:condensin complex subunit 2 isoform X2 n=1 Tax=Cylas formicarius TaxID=197179 RepID=UPI0029589161|nr:condensin complex subunit 2 isoform X2 [Cylas formicarius]